jgi:hypothetical protein
MDSWLSRLASSFLAIPFAYIQVDQLSVNMGYPLCVQYPVLHSCLVLLHSIHLNYLVLIEVIEVRFVHLPFEKPEARLWLWE